MSKKDQMLKCLVIGDRGVGKTSMIIKYSTGKFPPEDEYIPAVYDGAYGPTPYVIDDVTVHLSVWDTGGAEDYDRLRPLAYPMTDVFIICFSLVDPRSFQRVRTKYTPEVAHYNPDTPILVVGTKSDLRDSFSESSPESRIRPVYDYEGLSFAEQIEKGSYRECSALTGNGVSDVFEQAMRLVLNNSGRESEGRSWAKRLHCIVA